MLYKSDILLGTVLIGFGVNAAVVMLGKQEVSENGFTLTTYDSRVYQKYRNGFGPKEHLVIPFSSIDDLLRKKELPDHIELEYDSARMGYDSTRRVSCTYVQAEGESFRYRKTIMSLNGHAYEQVSTEHTGTCQPFTTGTSPDVFP